jgi:hypothetical protein
MENYDKYICDDRPKPIPDELLQMSEAEIDAEFERLFGKENNEK